jgi:hypothetical protein
MKNTLDELVKKIILGATAILGAVPLFAKGKPVELPGPIDAVQYTILKYDVDKSSPKLILQKPKSNFLSNLFHTSHRSHSSHSSHRSHSAHSSHSSHYSGYNSSPTYTPVPEIKKPVEKPKEIYVPVETPAEIKLKLPAVKRLSEYKDLKIDSSIDTLPHEFGSRTLELGMTGTDVAELQEILIKKGYKIKLTAKYDAKTEKAVAKFQHENELSISGKVDALTRFFLIKGM